MATPPTQQALQLWLDRIRDWYPHLLERAYFLPAVHMNRTRHTERQVAGGQSVLVVDRPAVDRARGEGPVLSVSDTREDDCQQQVLSWLQQLAAEQQQVMFVLSQLKFGDYLNKPSYAAAASTLPKPGDLRRGGRDQGDLRRDGRDQGDFDVLIIHRQHGVVLGEVKSVGADPSFTEQPEERQDQTVKKRVTQAVRQLQKGSDVVRHILSDMVQPPRVAGTLVMPNVTRQQLQRVLASDQSLSRALSDCLGLDGLSDPSQVCLLHDDMVPEPPFAYLGRRNPAAPRRARWWRQVVNAAGGPDPDMTEDVYLELITRLAGPATTVRVHCSSTPRLASTQQSELRTPGDGVQETGSRFTPVDIVLHPRQVDVLNDPDLKLAFLVGPPGVGKTLMLLLKAREWLRCGKHVQLISAGRSSQAATHMLAQQLECSAEPGQQQRVHVSSFNFPMNHSRAAQAMLQFALQHSRGQELYIIMDEAIDVFATHPGLQQFVDRLCGLVPNFNMWAAGLFHELRPRQMTEVILTEPLRTPPAVTDIVRSFRGFLGQYVRHYEQPPGPLASGGPPVIRLLHEGGRHDEDLDTYQCEECGRQLAATLRHLGVGGPGRGEVGSPPPLAYRDVFVLCWDAVLRSGRDSEGQKTTPTEGLLGALSQAGFPLTVLEYDNHDDLRQVATNTGPDHVVAAQCQLVNGLERKVVVFVQKDGHQANTSDWGKLWAMSRCTSQLIWIRRPQDMHPTWPHEWVPPSRRPANDRDTGTDRDLDKYGGE